MRKPSILLIFPPALVLGCSEADSEQKSEEGEVQRYSLDILSPEQDSSFESGDLITLSVAVTTDNGDAASLDQVSWETGDWLANGNNLSVSDLPDGSRSLNVTAVAMGEIFTGSVDIHIGDESGDTGDTGDTDADFSGVIEATILLKLDASSGGTTYEDPCEGWVELNIEADVLVGEGSCRAFGEDWDFDISGSEDAGMLTGELNMHFDEAEPEPTLFTGTRDELDHLVLEFSGSHYPGEVSGVSIEYLTISGSITADPEQG
jgi:hypothetical protein